MEDYRLVAERRTGRGSRESERQRSQGRVPANLYGQGKEGIVLTVAADDVKKIIAKGSKVVDIDVDGTVEKAVIQELQWDTFSTYVRHVDLKRVDPAGMATTDVKIATHGEPAALKIGGLLKFPHKTVRITCSDFRVPPQIDVRIGRLGMGESITVADLTIPEGMKVETPADAVVVEIVNPRVTEQAAAEEPAPA